MKTQAHNPRATAFAVMQSFVRTLSLEPAYIHIFGEKYFRIAKYMVQLIHDLEPLRFNFASLLDRLIYRLPYSLQRWSMNQFAISGFDNIVVERKILMQQKILSAIVKEKCEQVLIIGAGYDLLAFAAAEFYKKVHFFEVDSGAVRDYKIGTLAKLFNKCRADAIGTIVFGENLHLIECDVNQGGLHHALVHSDFDSKKKTIAFIDEMTVPLEKAAIEKLMATLISLLARNSEVIIQDMRNTEEQLSSPDDVISYMNAKGFHVNQKITAKNEPEPYYLLSNAKLPKGSNHAIRSIYAPVYTSGLSRQELDSMRRSPDRPESSSRSRRSPS